MIKDKGMLREKDELTVSVSWEVRECELTSQSIVSVVKECGPRDREPWWREL